MLFIAGVFPVGIHFTTIATERTISAVVADEAFAKIRLYATGNPFDANDDIDLGLLGTAQLTNYGPPIVNINAFEFSYPSDPNYDISRKQYYWSALCRRVDPDPNSRLVQVTVFVCRKVGSGITYRGWAANWPVPVPVAVSMGPAPKELTITNLAEKTFINDGYTIIGNEYGRIFRVLERYDDPVNDRIIRLDLDQPWGPGNMSPSVVWVVPPPIGGGRCPFMAIYQRVIRF
jgi:hypothetical protein